MKYRDEAVANHSVGKYEQSLEERLERLTSMTSSHPERPGLLATVGLLYERMDEHDLGWEYADMAYFHEGPTIEPAEHAAVRAQQRPSVELNCGVVFLRAAARMRLEADPRATKAQIYAGQALRSAEISIREQRTGRRPHQHTINALSRLSMLDATERKYIRALGRGLSAVATGIVSESSRLVEGSSNLNPYESLKAKEKAVWRGAVALRALTVSLFGRYGARDALIMRYA